MERETAAINEHEFNVLAFCIDAPEGERISQRKIAQATGDALGSVNTAVQSLRSRGLIDGSTRPTAAGVAALEPYKVQNAVIMAAGMSSRFAPISYERPKGTLVVRGEVLIERQIRQLREAGIEDIVVVVGYRKEQFFYLGEKFGVDIVVNPDFVGRNNNGTLWLVRERLGNTYVCSSDDYFTRNPFRRYVWKAFYSAEWSQGQTDEYCLDIGAHGRIVGVHAEGGSQSWYMIGHVYFDRAFSDMFIEILGREYDEPGTAGKLWEDIFADHLDDLDMVVKEYEPGIINEFDSLDDVRHFDPNFIENVDSDVLDNICRVLLCRRQDIHDFVPIKKGLTNMSFRFSVGECRYVYRHPGAGTQEIINRESEAFSQDVAKDLGLDDTFIFEDAHEGWKISRFVDDAASLDYHDEWQVAQAMRIGRTLHTCGKVSKWDFDVYGKANEIVGLLGTSGRTAFDDFDALAAQVAKVHERVVADGVDRVLCHNDFYDPNFLVHNGQIDLIDWEYSGMSDYASDLGTFICCSDYTYDQVLKVLGLYFGREPNPAELRHCVGYVAISAWYWFVWAIYKDSTGDPVGPYLYLWYRFAKEYAQRALVLYASSPQEGDGGEAGADDAAQDAGIDESQFNLLRALACGASGEDAKETAEREDGLSREAADAAWVSLEQRGLVQAGAITRAGLRALEPYRIKNAIILAAGLSSRFYPLSLERPKGLIEVKGEPLIERQIRQLGESGIHDIAVVVGYMKEKFYYLADKFGVKLVENPYFRSKNNTSSINLVLDEIENTYICASDHYFARNIFEPYSFRSNYTVKMVYGRTDDYSYTVDERGFFDSFITHCDHELAMVGPCCFLKPDADAYKAYFRQRYEKPETQHMLWEELLIGCIGQMKMRPRVLPDGVVYEFDNLDELREFDERYIDNIDSRIVDLICETLRCRPGDLSKFTPMKVGLTNISFKFDCRGTSYIFRLPGEGTELFLSRECEVQAEEVAAQLGLDDTVVSIDPATGYKISTFIDGCAYIDPYDSQGDQKRAMQMLRRLHDAKVHGCWDMDFMTRADAYIDVLQRQFGYDFSQFEGIHERMRRLSALADGEGYERVLCHNDVWFWNFLKDGTGKITLIDWEYAGNNYPQADVADYVVSLDFDDEAYLRLAQLYEGHPLSAREMRFYHAMMALCAWHWFVWGIYTELRGSVVEDMQRWYARANHSLAVALELYEGK